MKRFVGFDVVRGILLLMMVVDHSPSSLRLFTDQPLGFFSTAECFVFVSAFLAGMIFRKRAEQQGFEAARTSSIRRAGRIYRAHLITVGFAFVLGSFFLPELPGLRNMLDHYLANPWAAIGGSVTLLFRPPLMDILPMYILFSLLTPAVFHATRRLGWHPVLWVSFATWLIAQTHVRDMLLNTFKDLPFIQLGPFDLFAWQLIWVGGLFIGQRFQDNEVLLPGSRWVPPLLIVLAITFLAWRWSSTAFGSDSETRSWLFDKWHLGPLRLINFLATASVAATFLRSMTRCEFPFRPFLLIGRHMLPVFCSQICLSILLIGYTNSGKSVTEPVMSALVLCQLLAAPLFAFFLERRSASRVPDRLAPQAVAYRVSTAETGAIKNPAHSRPARQRALQST